MSSNLPSLPLRDGALYIDASGWLENLTSCMRKLQYSQLNSRIKSDEGTALSFGTAIHLAMELRYQVYGTGPINENYWLLLNDILLKHFSEHPCPVDDWRNMNWTMELVRHYLDRYPTEDFSLLEYEKPVDDKVRMVELSFAVKLFDWQNFGIADLPPAVPIIYIGRIDLPIMLHVQLLITDHKTSSIMGASVFDNLNMSDQQKGYCWAFQEATGMKVHGYMPNVIRSKEPPQYVLENRPYKGKTQNPEQWWSESFQRDFHYLGEGELAEWKSNTISKVEEFLWHYSRGYLPMERTACTRFGRCQYFEVCTIYPPEERGKMLFSNAFKDNNWTPIKQ